MGLSETNRAIVRDAIAVALIAVLTVQGLRRGCGDYYRVPSSSMEPVLHGHPQDGDLVFVNKLASAAARQRGDLVVVQHPREPGEQLVKRIAACGDNRDEKFLNILADGDIQLGPDPHRLQRVQKEPLAARGQRVPWADAPGTAASLAVLELGTAAGDGGPWSVAVGVDSAAAARRLLAPEARLARAKSGALVPAGFVGTRKPVDAGYVELTGVRGTIGNDIPVPDAGLDVEITTAPAHVLAVVEAVRETLAFDWEPRSGRVVLWRDGEDVASANVQPATMPIRLEFGLLDDRAFFCLGGDAQRTFVEPRHPDWTRSGDPGLRTVVYVGGLADGDGARFAFRSLRAFHDVHAYRGGIVGLPGPPQLAQEVPSGHWFLLGDNTFDSHDSRHFGSVPARSFVGSPCCVLGPWPRTRWLRP